ncbi:MAG: biotin/lipoyl-containing protein [Flavobacteriales bacterium]
MNKWLIDQKDTQTLSGAAVKWFDHQFFEIRFEGKKYHGELVEDHSELGQLTIRINHRTFQVKKSHPLDDLIASMGLDKPKLRKLKEMQAPMPGRVTAVHVKIGQEVQPGDALLSLEAMKMENVLKAEGTGVVSALCVQEGDVVEKGGLLISFE